MNMSEDYLKKKSKFKFAAFCVFHPLSARIEAGLAQPSTFHAVFPDYKSLFLTLKVPIWRSLLLILNQNFCHFAAQKQL